MLDLLVSSHRRRLKTLANQWLAQGALRVVLLDDAAQVVRYWGEDQDVPPIFSAPVGDFGRIQLSGLASTAQACAQLTLEAELLNQIVLLESELEDMTEDLVTNQDQLLALYKMTHDTRLYLTIPQTLKMLVAEAARLIDITYAFAVLLNPDSDPIYAVMPESGYPTDQLSILYDWFVTTDERLFSLDEQNRPSNLPNTIDTLVLHQFKIRHDVTAVLGIVNKRDGQFHTPDIKLSRAIASRAAAYLENVLLHQETLGQARMQAEMGVAHDVQLNLLPTKIPDIAQLDIAMQCLPAREVGGDFYDLIQFADHPFTFVLGDVSGKGVSAGILMAVTRTALRTHSRYMDNPSPANILGNANDDLYADFTEVGMFTTVLLGQYHPEQQEIVLANAGHSPVIYCPAEQTARILEADAPPLGVLDFNLCQDHHYPFKLGDVLVLATDGMNEAENSAGDMYGYSRLLDLITSLASQSAADILTGIYADVAKFAAGHPPTDDQTMLVIKVK